MKIIEIEMSYELGGQNGFYSNTTDNNIVRN